MKNPEQAIDQVLAGLGKVEASPGMKRRILANLEESALVSAKGAPRRVWQMVWLGMTVASILIAVAVVHQPGKTSTKVPRHEVVSTPPSANGPGTRVQQASHLPVEKILPARGARPAQTVRRISAGDAALLAEMRAPSHPAPEVPLTQEEKLLLRAVRTGDPQVIAMLNPEERARQEAASEAEFQEFVEQSNKEDQQSDQTTD
jgi:hypothetical protein